MEKIIKQTELILLISHSRDARQSLCAIPKIYCLETI